jgi:hypothetical protein
MTDPRDPGHPVGEEIDSTQNMTDAAPGGMGGWETGEQHAEPDHTSYSEPSADAGQSSHTTQQRANDMLRQLQQMIDQLATQAGPPMREIAAKAAELAAVAAQRAGPLAVKAAEKTQVYGERFATKSKEMAAELRAKDAAAATEGSEPDMRGPENAG